MMILVVYLDLQKIHLRRFMYMIWKKFISMIIIIRFGIDPGIYNTSIAATSNNLMIVWMVITNAPWSGKSMILVVDLDLQKIHLRWFMYTTWFIIMMITNAAWSGKFMILLVDLDLQKIHLHRFMYTIWKKFIITIIVIRFG